MGCNVTLLFWRQIWPASLFTPNFVLHVTSRLHLPQWRLFGKEGILHLPFRETRRHIAAFTLLQMCHLFYLKGATYKCWNAATIPSTSSDSRVISNAVRSLRHVQMWVCQWFPEMFPGLDVAVEEKEKVICSCRNWSCVQSCRRRK